MIREGIYLGTLGTLTLAAGIAVGFRPGWSPLVSGSFSAVPDDQFVNWENHPVHGLELTPSGLTLLATNTADARLEVFDVSSGVPVAQGSVPVGIDPVSVRAISESEAWVVNHVSDSVSIVDLTTLNVVATIGTADEPFDVVFAGAPLRAYVTCSQANLVQVFDPTTMALTDEIEIQGEDPRALAVSQDGMTVYAGLWESGNGSTILGGGLTMGAGAFPPNVVNDATGPYGGTNPPPNDGVFFSPPLLEPDPPEVGLIVKQDDAGLWLDDTGADWTNLVSGPNAFRSGRPTGWTLLDHDIAAIDTGTHSVSYQGGALNAVMGLSVRPTDGAIVAVGTDGTNEIRFEPNLNGRFVRVNAGTFDAAGGVAPGITDLNPHLAYPAGPVFTPAAQTERDKSLGDPRAIAWSDDGQRAYVAGLGSNTVAFFDGTLARAGTDSIEVGEGPVALALDDVAGRLFVLNRFEGSISTIDTGSNAVIDTEPFFDPTPEAIRLGRVFLYGTHETSGLGQASCASCHIDGRFDRLAWDLGDPAGSMQTFAGNCPDGGCEDWHPMKGPMTTQTLQDIIGLEPHHWRGDRAGIEAFNPAFEGLLGDDTQLTGFEMQLFEDMLASIHFPPNPFRNINNTLPTSMPLDGHFTIGRFGPAGLPLPDGNAQAGLNNYRTGFLDGLQCVTCHTLPTGAGTNFANNGAGGEIAPGPNGEAHLQLVSLDGSTNVTMKTPQLRNMHEKSGFNTTQLVNTAGFGYLHDGSVDSIERFLGEPVFAIANTQELADMTAFMLAFAGSDLPQGAPGNVIEPPGKPGRDTHAAVGRQITLDGAPAPALLNDLKSLADSGAIGLIAHGVVAGEFRGYVYAGGNVWQSDRQSESTTHAALTGGAGAGSEVTFTAVPTNTATRMGVDRDADGFLNADEEDACADPADPASTPLNSVCCPADCVPDGVLNVDDIDCFVAAFLGGDLSNADCDGNGTLNLDDIDCFVASFLAGCP